jgi:hypothetical protein
MITMVTTLRMTTRSAAVAGIVLAGHDLVTVASGLVTFV